MRPPLDAVWTSRRKTPDGYYVVVLGLYAQELLRLEGAERLGRYYVYRTKSWDEVAKIIRRAQALGLDVKT
jgi:hypothetical protein